MPREKVENIQRDYMRMHSAEIPRVSLVGMRGYFQDSMGAVGRNDVGLYDDAIFLLTPDRFLSFNANTDPSRLYTHVAVLSTGVWQYKIGIHGLSKSASRRYKALVQAGEVAVDRYQQGRDHGYFGINIHKGNYTTTSSAGCQTIHPDQWAEFIKAVETELKLNNQVVIPYLLVEQQG